MVLIISYPWVFGVEAEKTVKWVLLVSVIMFFASVFASVLIYIPYCLPRALSPLDTLVFYINRIDTLLFIATITTAAVHTAGFGRKETTYRLSVILFIISMALFFATFLKWLFTYP